MKILRTRNQFLKWRRALRGSTLGFVPTMGALHRGHRILIERAKRENSKIVVSIFVNPTQFGPHEDFKKYPRKEMADLRLLKSIGVDAVFIPRAVAEIYARPDETRILPRRSLTRMMEAKFRPGHFEGVVTVVFKLFQIVRPTHSYFGEKDFQQLKVIEAMVEDLGLPTKIMACPTTREVTGLALSSRNQYLSPAHRLEAAKIYQYLKSSRSLAVAKAKLRRFGFRIQYLESWDSDLTRPLHRGKRRWLIAAFFHGVRLIDNLEKN